MRRHERAAGVERWTRALDISRGPDDPDGPSRAARSCTRPAYLPARRYECATLPIPRAKTGGKNQRSQSFALRHNLTSGRADLADGDDDGLEAESQDSRSECRRCREHGYIERGVDQEGHEAEDSPEAPRAVRARGEVPLSVQGVPCLSTRPSALTMQGVRWVIILRARSFALSMQGVRWGRNLRARS